MSEKMRCALCQQEYADDETVDQHNWREHPAIMRSMGQQQPAASVESGEPTTRDAVKDAENFVRHCIMTGHDLAADKELASPSRLKARVDAITFSLAKRIVPSYAAASRRPVAAPAATSEQKSHALSIAKGWIRRAFADGFRRGAERGVNATDDLEGEGDLWIENKGRAIPDSFPNSQ